MSKTLDIEAQNVLRAIYDLLDADLQPTLDLLGRLLGHSSEAVFALVVELRAAGMLQVGTLSPTMIGLALAVGLPAVEPKPMVGKVVWLHAA